MAVELDSPVKPPPRQRHQALRFGNKMIIFGGGTKADGYYSSGNSGDPVVKGFVVFISLILIFDLENF